MWRDPAVRRLGLARFISHSGGTAAFFVGIWGRAAFEFNASPHGIAVLMGLLGASQLVGGTLAGVLVDRWGPRRVLVAGEVVFAPATLALVFAGDIGELAALSTLGGFVAAIVFTAVTSYPPYLTDDPARLQATNSALEVAGTAAFVAGPAIGAVLVRLVGLDAIFVFDAATSLVAVAMLVGLPQRASAARAADEARPGLMREARAGFAFAYRHRVIRYCLLLGTCTWLLFGVFGTAEPIFFRDVLHADPETLGWVNAVFGVGLAAGAWMLGRFPPAWVRPGTLAVLTVASAGGGLLYAGTHHFAVVVAGAVVWGSVLGLLLPMIRTVVQTAAPERLIGRAMAALQVHHNIGELGPLLFVPALAAAFGPQRTLVGASVAAGIAGLVALAPGTRLTVPVPSQAAPPATHADEAPGEVLPGPPAPVAAPLP